MPEINHKDPTATAATVTKVAQAIVSEGIKSDDLEAKILEVLNRKKQEREKAAQPKEPDWAQLTEADAYRSDVYIPVLDHDIPDYMNMKLKDQEYVVVWANKDQRRLGALLAEGYEILKKEHVHPDFKVPLIWSSDGAYEYADTVCMRVHKRIILSKRRKAFEISMKQLATVNKVPRSRFTVDDDIQLDPGMGFYEAQ
jgi:hypothetical protein